MSEESSVRDDYAEEEEQGRLKQLNALLDSIRRNEATRVSPEFPLHAAEYESIMRALEGNSSVKEALLDDPFEAEGAKALAAALGSEECAISRLELWETEMGDEGMAMVADALERNTTVRHLRLESNRLGSIGLRALARALQRNRSITELSLHGELVDVDAARAMADALQSNPSITSFRLSHNNLGDEGAIALAPGLQRVVRLALGANELEEDGVAAISEALEKGNAIAELDLTNNPIGASGGQALGRVLEKCSRLTSLNMNSTFLELEGIQGLATGLAKTSSLLTLILEGSHVGDAGAEAISQALEGHASVTQLDMGENGITSVGALALARMLERNSTLAYLRLSENPLGGEGGRVLCKALEKNSTLITLHMDRCDITGGHEMAAMLERNACLSMLFIGYNRLERGCMKALGAALAKNSSLTALDISKIPMELDEAEAFATALEANTSLIRCHVRNCCLKGECADRVVAALKKNVVVTNIWPRLRGCSESSEGIISRNTGRRARFVEALLHGSLDEAQQFVEEGVDVHSAVGHGEDAQHLLLAVLKAGRLDSFEMLLQTRFARSLLFNAIWPDALPPVVDALRDELWRFPRHEGIMARLWELVGSNVHLAGLLGQLGCRHAARSLYGVLRKRFKVTWCSSAGGEPKFIPRDMARMLAQYVWHSRFNGSWRG